MSHAIGIRAWAVPGSPPCKRSNRGSVAEAAAHCSSSPIGCLCCSRRACSHLFRRVLFEHIFLHPNRAFLLFRLVRKQRKLPDSFLSTSPLSITRISRIPVIARMDLYLRSAAPDPLRDAHARRTFSSLRAAFRAEMETSGPHITEKLQILRACFLPL